MLKHIMSSAPKGNYLTQKCSGEFFKNPAGKQVDDDGYIWSGYLLHSQWSFYGTFKQQNEQTMMEI